MKAASALLLCFGLAAFAHAQDKVFDWVPGKTENISLGAGYYHAGHVYRPGPRGGNMHVDIESSKPVTVMLAPEGQWNDVVQHPEHLSDVDFTCMQQHVTKTTYVCNIPPQNMVLVVRDERPNPDRAVLAGLAAVDTGEHKIADANDLRIQYYSWLCIRNCAQPEFQWSLAAKEQFQLTPIMKIYDGVFPDHDGEHISLKIKSPVPMAVAVLPSSVANQLSQNPETFQSVVAKSACQQRGIREMQWACPLNVADGPQSVVVIPESATSIPHKKAEIEIYATKCVANCGGSQQEQDRAGN